MDGCGFIRENLDIKILILFILNRLPGPVDEETLMDLTLCDKGFTYFEYASCLADLVRTEHVTLTDGFYTITEKGARNGYMTESSLPYSVRIKSEKNAAEAAKIIQRRSMVKAGHAKLDSGAISVNFSLSDGIGEIMKLELVAPSEEYAEKMEKNFKENAESIFNQIVTLLADNAKK